MEYINYESQGTERMGCFIALKSNMVSTQTKSVGQAGKIDVMNFTFLFLTILIRRFIHDILSNVERQNRNVQIFGFFLFGLLTSILEYEFNFLLGLYYWDLIRMGVVGCSPS